MNDKEYKHLVGIVVDLHDYLVSVATEEYYESVKYHTWLQLIGLMETADLTNE